MVVLYDIVHIPQQFWKSSLKLINLHAFADDHAISDSFNPSVATSELNSVMKLSGCLDNVGSWMDSNRLKMNAQRLR